MSYHECPVIKIKLEKHPSADRLSLVRIGGYIVCVRTEDWQDGDLAIYIPPDNVCPDTEQFAFLGANKRIKVRKFCGVPSMGLLVKAPPEAKVGENWMDNLGIVHYEPPEPISTSGENVGAPCGIITYKYDVENLRSPRFNDLIKEGDNVVITEKIHGANARFVFSSKENKMYCGSRIEWKKQSDTNLWWKALSQNPFIEGWCTHYHDMVLYGEVFGQVQNLKYGAIQNQIMFAAFDILYNGEWMEYDEARKISPGVMWVPELYRGKFNLQLAEELADGDSSIINANHHREGVVVRPLPNKFDIKLGRVQLKIVGNKYLGK